MKTFAPDERGLVSTCPRCGQRNRLNYDKLGPQSRCGPCKMMAPELAKAAGEGAGRWLVAKANTDELPGPAQRFRIKAIPTMVLFKRGHEVARQSGAMPAQSILRFIEQGERTPG